MERPDAKSIEEATERVKQRLPIEEIRKMDKYRDISPEGYEKLIKDAETFALLVLEAFFSAPENRKAREPLEGRKNFKRPV